MSSGYLGVAIVGDAKVRCGKGMLEFKEKLWNLAFASQHNHPFFLLGCPFVYIAKNKTGGGSFTEWI